METTTANLKGQESLGNGNRSSDQEILNRTLKRWRHGLGYASILATIPSLVISQVPGVLADETKQQEVNVADRTAKLAQRASVRGSNPGLLKRQSAFRLPHQKGNFAVQTALAGNDDCPGAAIPGGSYTAAAPFVATGDTTGANNTISTIPSYYYSTYGAFGPDHVYSFTLTALGPNPRIEVSTTSSTYRPLIYVMDGRNQGGCPAGSGNSGNWPWAMFESRWTNGSTATVNLDYFLLNVPFHLFVDSQSNDAAGAGSYTIRMQDVTIAPVAPCTSANPIDCADFFVRQQYLDFFGREPDTIGFDSWVNTLRNCPNGGYGEFDNPQSDRVHVSAGFYQSHEFQERGYWLLRFSEVGLDRRPTFAEFTPDLQQIGGSKSPAEEDAAKIVYTNAFVQRQEFQNRYAGSSNSQYVDALEQNAGVALQNKQALINALNIGTNTRADVLRSVVESQVVFDKFIIPGFVTMEYFGYLRRDPDTIGYQNWVDTLMANPNDYRHMIFGFIYSTEYRARFGPQ